MIYITLGIVVALLSYIWFASPLATSDRVGITTAISTVALAIYTSIYAWYTRKMANEIREQRLSEVRPYLLLKLTDEWVDWPLLEKIDVTIRNEGKGPAINARASLWHPKTIHAYDSKGYLASNEEWKVSLSTLDVGVPYEGEKEVRPWLPELKAIIRDYGQGAVVVQYYDIHNRKWISYLSLEKVSEDVPYVRDGEQNIIGEQAND